jgi:predicted HTH transcriptional regulator
MVTISFNWINKTGNNVSDKVGDKAANKINKTQTLIMKEMRDNPNITLLELQSTLSLGRTSIQNNVSSLRKNQIIKRVG